MGDQHSRSFFGQNTALIVKSTSKSEDWIFLQVLKKKNGNVWEKPSQGEGKIIKLSLEEMVMILRVLRGKVDSWNTFHSYKDKKTQISFKWQEKVIWININHYSKMLDGAQIVVMKLLLEHLLQEKIEYATTYESGTENENGFRVEEEIISPESHEKISNPHSAKNEPPNKQQEPLRSNQESTSEKEANVKDVVRIKAHVQRTTKKAVLLHFPNDQEAWIPKSTIHTEFSEEKEDLQTFAIDKWVLDNNSIEYQ